MRYEDITIATSFINTTLPAIESACYFHPASVLTSLSHTFWKARFIEENQHKGLPRYVVAWEHSFMFRTEHRVCLMCLVFLGTFRLKCTTDLS